MIGISCSFRRREPGDPRLDRFCVNADYVRSIVAAGGIPVVLPHAYPHISHSEGPAGNDLQAGVLACLESLDGLLLSGGGDLDPRLYGELPHPRSNGVDHERDIFEVALARAARDKGMPLLAICRGIQVLNVSAGGTLIQDIPVQVPGAIGHNSGDRVSRSDVSHPISVVPESILGRIVGRAIRARGSGSEAQGCGLEIWVNSLHHQAVKDVANSFRIVALSSRDGIIEAIEAVDHPFCVGVQWHPEAMTIWDTVSRELFAEFVRAAGVTSHPASRGRLAPRRRPRGSGAPEPGVLEPGTPSIGSGCLGRRAPRDVK